jgi:hypothetical protein
MRCIAELAGLSALGGDVTGSAGCTRLHIATVASAASPAQPVASFAGERARGDGAPPGDRRALRWVRSSSDGVCAPRVHLRITCDERVLVEFELAFAELVRLDGSAAAVDVEAALAARVDRIEGEGGATLVLFRAVDGVVWVTRADAAALLDAMALWPKSARCTCARGAPAAPTAIARAEPSPARTARTPPPSSAAQAGALRAVASRLRELRALEAARTADQLELSRLLGARGCLARDATSREASRCRLAGAARALGEAEHALETMRAALSDRRRALDARRRALAAVAATLPPEPPAAAVAVAAAVADGAPPLPAPVVALRHALQLRRAAMLMQLQHVFVIRVASDGAADGGRTYTINQLRPVPLADAHGSDDEENAAALGLIAQLAQTAARVLLLPLHHTLELCTSRSHVLDRSTPSAPTRFPLFARGSEPLAHQRAQQLLGHDIHQLLDAVGVTSYAPALGAEQLLPNLEVLMSRVRKAPLAIRPW